MSAAPGRSATQPRKRAARRPAPGSGEAASLARYRRMRNFAATPEPQGGEAAEAGERPAFCVQRHAARRLHYDFRLELAGVLKSWAVPKGPSLDPAEKRLAVETEDHPLEYGDFEGTIPANQYGAGEVVLWDRGRWSTDEADPAAALARGKLKFRLEGEKLHGAWTLVRLGGKRQAASGEAEGEGGARSNWLLIKERDGDARTGKAAEITVLEPGSVRAPRPIGGTGLGRTASGGRGGKSASGEVAGKAAGGSAGAAERKAPGRAAAGGAAHGRGTREPAPRSRAAPLPAFVTPQLATLAQEAPQRGNWVYEVKYDGYRILARIEAGTVRLFTRNGNDWTRRLEHLARALSALDLDGSWLDGEICVHGKDGLPDFQALQNAFETGGEPAIVYYLFDAPWLGGQDLAARPLAERKRLLAAALDGKGAPEAAGGRRTLGFSEHFTGDPAAALEQACGLGLEGLIGKEADAPYTNGRSRSWIKLKCRPRQEFVVGGYTEPAGSRKGFGALLVGLYDDAGDLHYAGKVGSGFDQAALQRLAGRLAALARQDSPFVDAPKGKGVHWVRPALVAEIAFAGWTADKFLRQASFLGLREDKKALTVHREVAMPKESAETGAVPGRVSVAGVSISHPDRVLWPDNGLTKADLARYYAAIGDRLLPQLDGRPLSLVRCPEGSAAECFFQRHMGGERPAGVESFVWERSSASRKHYLYVNSLEAVIGMVQRGVIEFHTWGSTLPKVERPDRITFDLDPGPDLPWDRVVEGAKLVRGLLDELGLASFLKTTGGKGLHLVVPLKRSHDWDEVKAFSKAVAEHMARVLPDRFTANMAKARRVGRIFLDYLRNDEAASAVAAYSARARPGAPVSTPLAWDELTPELSPADFNASTIPQRLAALHGDPWEGYGAVRHTITAAMRGKLGL